MYVKSTIFTALERGDAIVKQFGVVMLEVIGVSLFLSGVDC